MRRRGLAVLVAAVSIGGAAGVAGAQPELDPGPVQVIATFDGSAGELVEGVEAARDGSVYVSLPLTGEIRRIAPDGTETTIATLPNGDLGENGIGPLGLESDQFGRVYAAVATFDPATTGVYVIDTDGAVERLPGSETIPWPNGLEVTPNGTVWVTDTTGAVWVIPRGGIASEWIRDPLLEGDGSLGFGLEVGANGVAVHHKAVYVTVTEGARVVRIPISPDGAAGALEVLAEDPALFGADGMVADTFGNLYIANLVQSAIQRVRPTGSIEAVATSADGVDVPSSVAFGWGAAREMLYFVQFLPTQSPSLLASIDTGLPGVP